MSRPITRPWHSMPTNLTDLNRKLRYTCLAGAVALELVTRLTPSQLTCGLITSLRLWITDRQPLPLRTSALSFEPDNVFN